MLMRTRMQYAIIAAALLLGAGTAAQRSEAQQPVAPDVSAGNAVVGYAAGGGAERAAVRGVAVGHGALGGVAVGRAPVGGVTVGRAAMGHVDPRGRLQADGTLVIIVRHAEKVDDSDDPVLSEAGVQRAEALARALRDAEVSVIYTTPLRRTRDTAAPLTASTGVPVTVVDTQGSAQERAEDLAARIRGQPQGSVVLVVGHSNTVPAIIVALGGPDIGVMHDDDYADFFVLHLAEDRARLVRSRY
jgi:phosphohistidine phosphatase SixA